MTPLQPERYGAVKPLFDLLMPDRARVFGVLEGKIPGQVFVNDRDSPDIAIVYSAWGRCLIPGLIADQAAIRVVINNERDRQDVHRLWPYAGRGGMRMAPPETPDSQETWIFFSHIKHSREELQKIAARAPEGSEIVEVDSELAERCACRDSLIEACGSLSSYLEIGFGLAMLKDGEILAEAHAPVAAAGRAILQGMAREDMRGMGYAQAVFARLALRAMECGYEPTYSAPESDQAALRMARSLGFAKEDACPILKFNARS